MQLLRKAPARGRWKQIFPLKTCYLFIKSPKKFKSANKIKKITYLIFDMWQVKKQ
jgi:hypothetical protein